MAFTRYPKRLARAVVIASVFLCMQLAAVTHAASYGDATHSHDGAPCLIQILSDSPAKGPAPLWADTGFRFGTAPPLYVQSAFSSQSSEEAHPIRAPPGFSL